MDPRDLNRAIKKEHFKLPTREEITSQFANAKYFSKLDASSGFWQLKLDNAISKLCTFNSPFGRYRLTIDRWLPFGIASAPEVYHKTIHMIYEHLDGVDTSMDDIIVWGTTKAEHDMILRKLILRFLRQQEKQTWTWSWIKRNASLEWRNWHLWETSWAVKASDPIPEKCQQLKICQGHNAKRELSVVDGIIYKGSKIVIPKSLRGDMIKKIHTGHLGIEKCKKRAREVMYLLWINQDVTDEVSKCSICLRYQTSNPAELLKPHPVPDRPYQKVGADLFVSGGKDYIVVTDYYSLYPEVCRLHTTTAETVITSMKAIFSRHGVPSGSFHRQWTTICQHEVQTVRQRMGLYSHNIKSSLPAVWRVSGKVSADGEEADGQGTRQWLLPERRLSMVCHLLSSLWDDAWGQTWPSRLICLKQKKETVWGSSRSSRKQSRSSIMTEEQRTYLYWMLGTKWGLKTKQTHGHRKRMF